MDAPPLPDDPRDWPADPFALLGVPRSAGESDLKRAYTRLIKKYKPEHAPEEFRRIREAYEAALEMGRWYRDAPPVRDAFPQVPFPPPGRPEPVRPSAPREPQIDSPVRAAHSDPVDVAWADGVAGNWPEAYAALQSLAQAHPERTDLPLRLYWLLALRPALDASRTRHDWLASALARARLAGPAVELYRRELAADPSVALYGPYLGLLEAPDVRGRDLLAFASLRLPAAAQESRWSLLEIDLEALARRAADLDESAWLGYLTDLAGRCAGDRTALAGRCRELLAGLRHLELSHAWAFDALDDRKLNLARLKEAHLPEPIRRALAAALTGGDPRGPLAEVAAWAAGDPAAALRACDTARFARAGGFLDAFERLLARRDDGGGEVAYPPELIRQFARLHAARSTAQDYASAREPLLRFLLAERIDPEELAGACASDPATRLLAQRVRGDHSLRLVYRTASSAGG
jgi:hypothetical protein